MLARGGNAFDAALAACFVESVALPMKCGLAGDLVALLSVKGGPVQALVSIGAAPGALGNGAHLQRLGPCSIGVPGAPDGYAQLHALARLSMGQLTEPAIHAAEYGVPWTRIGLSYLAEARDLLEQWSPNCPYLRNGEPAAGDMLRLPGMAALLDAYSRHGAAVFEGGIGHEMTAHVRSLGGFLSDADLQARPARWCEPVCWNDERGRTVYATPDPTHGPLLIEALAERRPSEQADTAKACSQAAIVARVRERAKLRGRDVSDDGTSVVTAADTDGNIVVVVHSNSYPRFGSGVVLDNGLVLNNRPGRGFDMGAPPGARHAPAPGSVPPTTLHAWAVRDAEGITFGATPGGVNQLPWNYQMLDRLLADESLAEALLAARWAVNEAGDYSAEAGLDCDLPFNATTLDYLALRSAQQAVRRRSADGLLEAVADPRVGASSLAIF